MSIEFFKKKRIFLRFFNFFRILGSFCAKNGHYEKSRKQKKVTVKPVLSIKKPTKGYIM